jgi:hypothetical protein
VRAARRGEGLVTHVADGTIRSVVEPSGRRRGGSVEAPQMDLFDERTDPPTLV